MYIVVLGAGAMGCLFGGRLAERGHRVVLADVRRQHVEAINTHGLAMENGEGERRVPVRAKFPHELAKQAELLLIFTKTFQTAGALKTAKNVR